MKAEGWREVILDVIVRVLEGDELELDRWAQEMADLDTAKQRLHDAGFGVTGTSLLRSVNEVLGWIEGAHNPADGADGL